MPFCASLTTSLQMALYHYPEYPFRKKQAQNNWDSCWVTKEKLSVLQGSCFLIQKVFWGGAAASNIERSQGFVQSNLLYCRLGWDLVGRWVLIHRNPCSTFPWSIWSVPLLKIGWWVEQISVMTLSGNSYGRQLRNLTRSQSVSKDLQSGLQCQ